MERKFNDQEQFRRQTLAKLKENNENPFEITKVTRNSNSTHFRNANPVLELASLSTDDFHLAGRVMNMRQTFAMIQDQDGQFQVYFPKSDVSEAEFARWKQIDIGDILSISGKSMLTKTGQLTLKIASFKIISKSLKVLPEKWHGLVDEEEKSRRRYLDMIMSRDSFDTLMMRSKIVAKIREFMASKDYIEVETPILQPILGGAAARPFITHHNALDMPFYLRIAPELYLKRCIVGGMERVFEIGRLFRNEGIDATHNPEFTSMEAYIAYEDMEHMLKFCEALVHFLVKELKIVPFEFKSTMIDLSKPFKRIDMCEFVKQETGEDFKKVTSFDEAKKIAAKHHIKLEKHHNSIGHIINLFFEEFCEKKCIEPTFVTGHPVEISPLAKRSKADPRYTDRFELFITGREFMNAFSELNDPIDQYERLNEQIKLKDLGDLEANEMDLDFIEALEYGLPPTAGMGVGIDRLAMLLANKSTIRDVLIFPHLKNRK